MSSLERLAEVLALHGRYAAQDAGGSRGWVTKKRAVYGSLGFDDAVEVAKAIVDAQDEEFRDEVLLHLACLKPGSLG